MEYLANEMYRIYRDGDGTGTVYIEDVGTCPPVWSKSFYCWDIIWGIQLYDESFDFLKPGQMWEILNNKPLKLIEDNMNNYKYLAMDGCEFAPKGEE